MRQPRSADVARLVGHRNVFSGEVSRVDHEAERTWITWAGHELECQLNSEFAVGETVDWMIPSSEIVLHRRDRPSRGEHENPVFGDIREMIVLADDANFEVSVENETLPISFEVSAHVARRNGLDVGERVGVSLLSSGIHLMAK